jgi:translocation and assembly module TamA
MLLREVNPASGSPSALGPRAARRDISAASRLAVLTLAALLALTSPRLTAEAVAQQAEQAAAEQTQQSASVDLKVEITGLDEELQDNVEALAGIVRTSRSRTVRPGHVYRMHEKAPEQIATALEPFGFYSPTIRSSLTTEGSPWVARYDVDPGPPTLITRLDVRVEGEAGQDSVFVQTLASLPLAEGDTLDHRAYETAKTTLGLLAADRGYFDAVWDSSLVRVDRETSSAEIVLHLTSGPRFRFGEVTLDAYDWVDTDLLLQYVEFQDGDPYESSYLRRLQSNLAGTTYFANVEAIPRRDLADDELRVPIEVHARPRKTQRWEVGLGYGTDTGPRIRLSTEFRRLSRAGHYADLDARISTTEQSITARYNIPVGIPYPSLWTVTGRYGNIEWVTSKTLQGIAGLSFAHLRGDVREILSLRYQHDDFSVAADTGVANLTQPVASWSWSKADDPLYAHRGIGGTLELRGAVDGVASSASFFRAVTALKTIFPLREKLRGIVRADIGWLGTDQFRQLPPSIRFFAGGDRSIRGYEYQSLGPVNPDGQVTGGNSLLVGSAEVEYRFFKQWSGAVFLDAGNAFNDFQGEVAFGIGFGARWISPVGLVRIDLGFGLNKEGNPLRLHLGIGPDF